MTATVAGIHLGIDTHANRPAANTVPDGSQYSCSTHSLIYKSDFGGNSWATWATLGSAASNPGATLQKVDRTAGDITLTGSTTTHTECSSALRLTLPAASGDVLQIGISAYVTPGTGEWIIDSATIVSAAIVNQCSPGARHVGHGDGDASVTASYIGATITYVVQSGDISGGNVVVSPTFRQSGTAGTLLAGTNYALRYWALNLKQ